MSRMWLLPAALSLAFVVVGVVEDIAALPWIGLAGLLYVVGRYQYHVEKQGREKHGDDW